MRDKKIVKSTNLNPYINSIFDLTWDGWNQLLIAMLITNTLQY